MRYTELQVTTNFSFLRGASHPEEMVDQAIELGYTEIAITDRNTMAGIVRAHAAAKNKALRVIPACRLDLVDGPGLLAYPTDAEAYALLCSLLTLGNIRAEKGKCNLYLSDLDAHKKGIIFIVIPDPGLDRDFNFDPSFRKDLIRMKEILADRLYMAICRSYQGLDAKRAVRLNQLSHEMDIPLVATNDVHYHRHSRRPLQDVLTCIREKCTIQTAGYQLHPNAERYLKPREEMHRLFRQFPGAIDATQTIAQACRFSLDDLSYEYPEEITSEGRSPQEELEMLAWQGARTHFGDIVPEKTVAAIKYELDFIEKMNYAAYFLTVYDIVRYARE